VSGLVPRIRIHGLLHPVRFRELSPEDIISLLGATEALGIVFRALLSPGDTVIVESPTYFDYFRQLAAVKARVVEVPLAPGLGIDLDLLAQVRRQRDPAPGAREPIAAGEQRGEVECGVFPRFEVEVGAAADAHGFGLVERGATLRLPPLPGQG